MNGGPEIKYRAITLMKQRMEAGCVPTSISMVFSGFGLDISEQTLVDRYFPSAALPLITKGTTIGVTNTDTIKGIVQIIKDLGLEELLQTDVFVPALRKSTNSPEKRYIVPVKSGLINHTVKRLEKGSEERDFFRTLGQYAKKSEIGVYTVNSKMMGFGNSRAFVSKEAYHGFYAELADFIGKGHIVGPHGGLTMHTRALDGSRMERMPREPEEEGFVVMDPRGESYVSRLSSIVMIHTFGLHGDMFDYLFRVSPREKQLKPENRGFFRFLPHFRHPTL